MRPGRPEDAAAVLELWDGAIAWLVARGQLGQWGQEPASARPGTVQRVRDWSRGSGLTIAERAGRAVGASVIDATCPPYVPPVSEPETYLQFLISGRAGSALLRVDCWAGAPTLVAWYRRQGFEPTISFEVNDGWRGQVFEMVL